MRIFRHAHIVMAAALAACAGEGSTPPTDPPRCATLLSLHRGEVRVFADPAALACLSVPGVPDSSEYVFITANLSPQPNDRRSYLVTGGMPSQSAVAARRAGNSAGLHNSVEAGVRLAEQRLVSRATANAPLPGRRATHRFAATIAPAAGDHLVYHVPDAAAANLCDAFADAHATVRAVSTTAIIAVDDAAPANGFTTEQYAQFAAELDQLILPTDADWFGAPTDVNGDGHVTVLFTPQVNRLTPRGSSGYIGGFFFASDLLARSIPAEGWRCDSSNEQEIFYLLAPDPDGTINGNRFSIETATETARGTIAHELQHMINQGVRQTASRSATLETAWLNEGLSHLAEELVGRVSRGYSASRRLSYDDVLADLEDYDSFFRQNLVRYRAWLAQPDAAAPIGEDAANDLATRGAAWALLRYAIDRYGATDPRALARALVAGPETGVANLEQRTHRAFDEIAAGFLVASFGRGAADAKYAFDSWAMRDVLTSFNISYPLLTTALPATVTARSPAGSGNYYLLSRAPGAPEAIFKMQGSIGSPVEFPGARVIVLRVH